MSGQAALSAAIRRRSGTQEVSTQKPSPNNNLNQQKVVSQNVIQKNPTQFKSSLNDNNLNQLLLGNIMNKLVSIETNQKRLENELFNIKTNLYNFNRSTNELFEKSKFEKSNILNLLLDKINILERKISELADKNINLTFDNLNSQNENISISEEISSEISKIKSPDLTDNIIAKEVDENKDNQEINNNVNTKGKKFSNKNKVKLIIDENVN